MLLPFFTWLGNTAVSLTIRDSTWIYALDQAFHLLCLAVFAGAVLIVDLRLMGSGLKDRPISQVARDAQPWMVWSLVGLFATGIPQLMSNSIKEYYSIYFWVKMGFLLVAFIYMFAIRNRVAMSAPSGGGSFLTKLVGLVSIVLWAGVAITARLIGLLS
jgi:hypothetical protein